MPEAPPPPWTPPTSPTSPTAPVPAASPPPPGAGPRRPWSTFLLGALAGLVVAGVVAAIVILVGGGNGDGVDTSAIELPDQVGAYRAAAEATEEVAPGEGTRVGRRYERAEERGSEQVSAAYDGAAASVRIYADDDLESIVTAVAVRAPSPGLLTPGFADAEDLGLEVPIEEVRSFGDVECLLSNPPTPTGQDVDEDLVRALVCQQTDDELTVRVQPGSSATPRAAARLVEDIWAELTG